MATTTEPNYQCHIKGAICFVKPLGCPGRWLMAHVVRTQPLTVEVLEDDPVWHGAELTRLDAKIRVDPKHWPKERRAA